MKAKLAFAFARAVTEIDNGGAHTIPPERVLQIDRDLRYIYDSVPDHYKLGQLSERDSLVLTSARFVLASIHHKSLCVVHSKFHAIGKKRDPRYSYSRRICLTSAMTILRFQAIQNQEIPVDGRLRSLTNYQNSLALHDYLLAATILSTDLSSTIFTSGSADQPSAQGIPSVPSMIKALEVSALIFRQSRDRSIEAFKAADVLGMLVAKFKARDRDSPRHLTLGQGSQTRQASWSNPKSSTSAALLTTHPPHHRAPYRGASHDPLSTNMVAGAGMETSSGLDPPPPRHLAHQSTRTSQSANTKGPFKERPGFLDTLDSGAPLPWYEVHDNDMGPQPPALPDYLSGLESSTGWAIPDCTDEIQRSSIIWIGR
jgi:hypothetical protein